MHQALYRKWRPDVFDNVYGQEHITSVLRYEAEHEKFNHAYLFCGSRGTGKTTCAKILAKVINCEHPENGNPCGQCASCIAIESGAATDVIEMDAASNNGVDNIRDIKDAVNFAPASLKCRVYIIDEVHMLSGSAFNALLKTLEEPPEYVVFILATTELQKLPATIISRCQRFDFRRISTENLCARLEEIATSEGIEYDRSALTIIARHAQGGMRDAISLLELCAGSRKKITDELVNESIGSNGRENTMQMVRAILDKNYEKIFDDINDICASSKDLTVFWQELITFYRDMLVVKTVPSQAERYLDLTKSENEQIRKLVSEFTRETLLHHCSLLETALHAMIRANAIKRVTAEMTLVKMCDESLNDTNASLLSRISKLETAIATGSISVSNQTSSEEEAKPSKTSTKDKEDTSSQVKGNVSVNNTSVESPDTISKKAHASDPSTRVLKKFKGWADTLDHITKNSPTVAGIIKLASAYTIELDGNTVYIIKMADNSFTKSMMESFGGRKQIREALCVTLGKEIPEAHVSIEYVVSGEQSKDRIIDELLENADN